METVEPDYWRQLDIFSPPSFKKDITVIGAGATGSYIAWLLAKMGCKQITAYDFDVVEDYNLPNQIFLMRHVDLPKVEALGSFIQEATGIKIQSRPTEFQKENLKGIVFVLTDTMKSRKEIWDNSIKNNPNVELLIETRMEAEGGRIYAVNPIDKAHIKEYEETLYSDDDAEESPCTRRSISSTVATIAGVAVSTLINFHNKKHFPNEAIISLSPLLTLSNNWKSK